MGPTKSLSFGSQRSVDSILNLWHSMANSAKCVESEKLNRLSNHLLADLLQFLNSLRFQGLKRTDLKNVTEIHSLLVDFSHGLFAWIAPEQCAAHNRLQLCVYAKFNFELISLASLCGLNDFLMIKELIREREREREKERLKVDPAHFDSSAV